MLRFAGVVGHTDLDGSGCELVRSILHTYSTHLSIFESSRTGVAAISRPPPPHQRLLRTSRGPQGQTARPFSPVFGVWSVLVEYDRSSSLRAESTSRYGDTGPLALCCSYNPLPALYASSRPLLWAKLRATLHTDPQNPPFAVPANPKAYDTLIPKHRVVVLALSRSSRLHELVLFEQLHAEARRLYDRSNV